MILHQLRNLLYSTVTTSIDHFPHFIPLLAMTLALVLFFGGFAVYFWNKKQSYLVPAYYYVGVAVFVVVVDILARFKIEYVTSITAISILFLLFSAFGYWKKLKDIKQLIQTISNNKLQYATLFFVVLLSNFFFSKFIFNNGLHDEYQHHAVVEDMLVQGRWQIRDEMRYGVDLSDHYHYGWYYVVIFVKLVFSVSTEIALDLSKLLLFIPLLPLFLGLLLKYLKTNWYQSVFLSVFLLIQGPALFFFDAYTGNVFFSQANEIIYEPLFFQLAGITWFGLVFMVVFSAVMYYFLSKRNLLGTLVFVVFPFWALFLLNKAYLMIFVPTIVLICVHHNQAVLIKTAKKQKAHILLLVVFLGILSAGLVVGLKYLSPYLIALLQGTSGISFIRDVSRWGFPYSSTDGLAFVPLLSLEALRAFGVLPIIAIAVLVPRLFYGNKKFSTLLVFIFFVYLWLIPVVFNFSGSELALNKFIIPALWLSALTTVYAVLQSNIKTKAAVAIVYVSAMIAPLAYFSSISLPNSHIYWEYNDAITDYLASQNTDIVASIDDFEYAKYLINELDIQLVSVKAKSIDIDAVVEYEITTQKHTDEEPLAQTDTHYLYAK